jgi:hypothetical protein
MEDGTRRGWHPRWTTESIVASAAPEAFRRRAAPPVAQHGTRRAATRTSVFTQHWACVEVAWSVVRRRRRRRRRSLDRDNHASSIGDVGLVIVNFRRVEECTHSAVVCASLALCLFLSRDATRARNGLLAANGIDAASGGDGPPSSQEPAATTTTTTTFGAREAEWRRNSIRSAREVNDQTDSRMSSRHSLPYTAVMVGTSLSSTQIDYRTRLYLELGERPEAVAFESRSLPSELKSIQLVGKILLAVHHVPGDVLFWIRVVSHLQVDLQRVRRVYK